MPVGDKVKTYEPTVIKTTAHDRHAFLQGLEYDPVRGQFFESTGLHQGRSSLRRVEIGTGKVLQQVGLGDDGLFGEGLTMQGTDRIVMLTWQAGVGFVFDQKTFKVLRKWKYKGEGWGLATDRLTNTVYMSDGTSAIRVLDPETLEEKRRFEVTMDGKPQKALNELEWICGEIWANVWMTKRIVRIDPATGKVRSQINVPNLPRAEDMPPKTGTDRTYRPDVLNGIAYSPEDGRIWITGKLWPAVYEVTINDNELDSQCNV